MISPDTLDLKADSSGTINYPSNDGYFFIYNSITHYPTGLKKCREEFHRLFSKSARYIGFSCAKLNLKKFNQFLVRREESLNIPADDQTVIYKTNRNSAVILKLSSFWLKDSTSRSLLTLLIRLGVVHYTGNFDESIERYNLAKNTKLAINHYLSGNTTPTYRNLSNGWSGGFASKFRGKSQEDLDKMLIKPPGENENGQTQIKEEKISEKIS